MNSVYYVEVHIFKMTKTTKVTDHIMLFWKSRTWQTCNLDHFYSLLLYSIWATNFQGAIFPYSVVFLQMDQNYKRHTPHVNCSQEANWTVLYGCGNYSVPCMRRAWQQGIQFNPRVNLSHIVLLFHKWVVFQQMDQN